MRRHVRDGLRLLLGAALIGLLVAPVVAEANTLKTLTELLTMLVLAWMWNLLVGYANIVTIGQHAFVGVGGYAFYGFAVMLGWHPALGLAMAALVSLLIALPVLGIVFRLRELYLAVGTWVVAEVLMLLAGKLPGFGGGAGTSLPITLVQQFGMTALERYRNIYLITLVTALAALASMVLLLRSSAGLGLTAMRDNEEAADACGVNTKRLRVLCFLWAAPFLGLAGALIALQKLSISPGASFSITDWTVFVIFVVVIGGIGSLEGPIIGVLLYFVLREGFADHGTWHLILLGALSIAILLWEPKGLWGAMRRRLGGDLIPLTHEPPPDHPATPAIAQAATAAPRTSTQPQ
ncbi:MAG: hypothetical protein RJA63_1467 [Pseudomonadota bacterium]|jgi:branched-chain amino acid transport system permease protein